MLLNREGMQQKKRGGKKTLEECLLFIIDKTLDSIFSRSNTQRHDDNGSGKTCRRSIQLGNDFEECTRTDTEADDCLRTHPTTSFDRCASCFRS